MERDICRLLGDLAGRLPDDFRTELGHRLADGHVIEVAHAIVFAAVASPAALSEAEAGLLISTLADAGEDTGLARAVRPAEPARAG
ncbi:hypothetical protein [Paractinoplanes brasiliensis]|uniref:Tellurite resistance protein TerB n=1 Tax=Paractinoplanes brasiliensis TaxID=52695 RepID=A0A4R6JQA5_9ACTN|nr:hypothetical protein [Actinoplanes brasiliensis]TDO37036.1 hypothetical protein C8E87_0630 [Actinoplanes brasiliensis]GID32272.1 hypothetical protein Abr02nite_72550 [Actinoplanes brasiliensis]